MRSARYRLEECLPGISLLTIEDEVDVATLPAFRCSLACAERAGRRGLIVRLDRSAFVSVRGFGLLATLAVRCVNEGRGRQLVVVSRPDQVVERVLRMLEFKGRAAGSVADALLTFVPAAWADAPAARVSFENC